MPEGPPQRPNAEYPPLISLAVHELRTPVSVVAGYLRMLLRDQESALSTRQRKMVEEAEKSCARISALISELSELGKLDANTVAVHEETFDLFQAIAEVAGDVHEARDRGVNLLTTGQAAGAHMRGDLTRLKAAFGGFFRAVLREQAGSCTVCIDRKRVGSETAASAVIVVAESSRVQEAYEAPRAPMDDHRGGLGLLLPIGTRVVERHGGAVWSPAIPNSNAIIVSLPLREPFS
jgi:signal transduction histidine kinase